MGAWIDWEEATLTWRPDGWTLTIPLELDEHEAHLLEPLVKELVPQTTSVWARPGPGGSLILEDPALPTALEPSRAPPSSAADRVVVGARPGRRNGQRPGNRRAISPHLGTMSLR